MSARGAGRRDLLILAAIALAGLALRLAVWRWREFQGLGGDEQEYFNAAVALLRDREYTELLFMRPPLYPVFLAASIYVVDSLVMNLRLVQAALSAATVPLVYLLAREVARGGGLDSGAGRRGALVAAALCALSYTLAANATELLTETLFLFGLAGALWLLLRAGRLASWRLAALAGLGIGALCLVRSVALPLLPLGAAWLLVRAKRNAQSAARSGRSARSPFAPAVAFVAATLLVVLPWTARNYATYGGVILIDTTGAENLWLDNDPAGREAVKAQLYAMGEDRLGRQQLATRRGLEAIAADPGRFAAKAWGELLRFFALEQSDDMLARPAIWVSPVETWARLLLGDALWLLTLLAGSYGLAAALLASPRAGPPLRTSPPSPLSAAERGGRAAAGVRSAGLAKAWRSASDLPRAMLHALRSPAWLLAPWALYVLLTTLIFHVELRYRLPLYPALLPYAGLAMVGGLGHMRGASRWAAAAAAALLALTLLHAPYPGLAWGLGWKHWHLGRAEAALARGDVEAARRAAEAALARDEGPALARVALA
ncbi:MAG TPA: glycosyltransferase family 39 protein, partial [Chloroflexaceae bacterium]|nr:glycosyltransferase family 39 protein [Chloroflexaceae bacterium]